jgi:FkbM family methyltransferase
MNWESTARSFCRGFLSTDKSRFVMGRNVYAESVADKLPLDGFIDDFTEESTYLGLPIIKTADLPTGSMVLIASGGQPLTAMRRLSGLGIENLDYFSFLRFSGLQLRDVVFNEGFSEEFQRNKKEYDWCYGLLSDDSSRVVFDDLVNFRNTYDIAYLMNFSCREADQYFEDFLMLKADGESFFDVGCYDGATTLEFIRRAPLYRSVYVFEPDPSNYRKCEANLSGHRDIHFHRLGLSDSKAILNMCSQNSSSVISDSGSVSIQVDSLDNILTSADAPTFIKMDIEGAEALAIEGARHTIHRHHPRLAICVYHKIGDYHKIARQILSIRNDYDVYLRHYTETIYETVMFFMPRSTSL